MKLQLRNQETALNVRERITVNVKFAALARVKTAVIGVRVVSRRFVSNIAKCAMFVKNVIRATSAAQPVGTRVVNPYSVVGVRRVEKESRIAIFASSRFARPIDKRRIATLATRVSVQFTGVCVVENVMD